jgi:hypothetical protein
MPILQPRIRIQPNDADLCGSGSATLLVFTVPLASFERLGCFNQCCGSGSGPFWSDQDLDVWDLIRIRILALINGPISTFLVCVKAINTLRLPVA